MLCPIERCVFCVLCSPCGTHLCREQCFDILFHVILEVERQLRGLPLSALLAHHTQSSRSRNFILPKIICDGLWRCKRCVTNITPSFKVNYQHLNVLKKRVFNHPVVSSCTAQWRMTANLKAESVELVVKKHTVPGDCRSRPQPILFAYREAGNLKLIRSSNNFIFKC